jgi:excisionase family DNA binding protein
MNTVWITKEEVAEILGVAADTVKKMAYRRELPHYKPSHKVLRFDRGEIDEWVRKFRVMAKPVSLTKYRRQKQRRAS